MRIISKINYFTHGRLATSCSLAETVSRSLQFFIYKSSITWIVYIPETSYTLDDEFLGFTFP